MGEKAASFINEMNIYLSSQGKSDDYNRYTIGILNKNSDVKSNDGTSLYTASKGHVVLVSDNRQSSTEINPDQNNTFKYNEPNTR